MSKKELLNYLAAPYSAPTFGARKMRAEAANLAAAKMMRNGHVVFSPLTHGHSIVEHTGELQDCSQTFWMRQCIALLQRCDRLVILPLKGWEESSGVQQEMGFARAKQYPIEFLHPGHLDRFLQFHCYTENELLDNPNFTKFFRL